MSYTTKILNVQKLKNEFLGITPSSRLEKNQKQSNFFLTINSQQAVSKTSLQSSKFVQRFQDVMLMFCEHIEKFITTHAGFPTDDKREIEIVPAIEVGKKQHRIHAHMTIEITHFSRIKLNLPKIRSYFKHNLVGVNPHVYLKHYYKSRISDEDRIKSYVLKGIKGDNDEDLEVLEELDF
jgi:hypothetical protein